MIRLLWATSARAPYFLRRYMPTDILIDAIHTRRGLKWGMPAMLLAANLCTSHLADGGPG
jgi:hypothetical protein